MKINNDLKNLFKIIFIGLILFSSIYVLYFLNNEYKIIENFAGTYDCSKCEIKPSSGNCKPIYEISYNWISSSRTLDICNIDTGYIFCEYEPNCSNDDLINNLIPQSERIGLTNNQINNRLGEYNITCCSGDDYTFYDSNIIQYSNIGYNEKNLTQCSELKNDISNSFELNELYDQFMSTLFETNYNYRKTKSICDTLDINSSILNNKGMLFKKNENIITIFDDPTKLPKDILDYISFSNIRNNLQDNDLTLLKTNVDKLENLNQILFDLARTNNLTRPININDLNVIQKTEFNNIKQNLKTLYSSTNIKLQSRKDISYNLIYNSKIANIDTYSSVTKTNGTEYLLNSDEFLNCMGDISNNNTKRFTNEDFSNNPLYRDIYSENNLFNVAPDASYNAYGSSVQSYYPNNKDLEMELKRLETIPSGGNAPVSVINTYLNAINNFYQKQVQNLTGPRDHVFDQQLVFDNNTLETKTPTFFTYENDENNTYECEDSITGNSKFKYCGPAAYSNIPKF